MENYKNEYELTFEENFSEGLEKNKWTASEEVEESVFAKRWGTVPTNIIVTEGAKHAGFKMHYRPENVYCADGHLVIKCDREEDYFQGGKVVCNGVVFARGYVEVEVLLPEPQKGVWPIFSLTATKGNQYQPIFDIVATHGDMGKNAYNFYIKWIDDIYEVERKYNGMFESSKRFYPLRESDEKLSSGYHTFGVELLEDYIVFYADRQEVNRISIDNEAFSVLKRKTFLKFNAGMSVGTPYLDAPEADIKLPTEFKIKSIKVYQREDGLIVRR